MKKNKGGKKRIVKKSFNLSDRYLFDVLNTVLVAFLLGMLAAFFLWITAIFSGNILASPIAFFLGIWPVFWYGIFFALAFVFGFILLLSLAKKMGRNIETIINIAFWTIVFGFLGAKIGSALTSLDYYSINPWQILNIWKGGLSIHGGIIGGAVFIFIYAAKKKLNAWSLLDIFAPALLLGQAIGTWGNLFNQTLFGYPADMPWGLYIAPSNRPWEFRNDAFFHPVFLYQSVLCFLALVILLMIGGRKKAAAGTVFLYYIIFYSVIRFILDFLLIEPKIAAGMTLVQTISLIFGLAALAVLILKRQKG